jgi:hypothetical protein
VKSLTITRIKQIRNVFKDALEWELKHMEFFCPSREHKKRPQLKKRAWHMPSKMDRQRTQQAIAP